jgi:2-C-methyl-D-erythritol 4-phosphate cytidylyltransferase
VDNKYALIVAGGKGIRMGTDIPKQFIEVGGKPVLMHTIIQFLNYNSEINIVLVLPQEHIDIWKKLCAKHSFNTKHKIVAGGNERFFSVKNGLHYIDDKNSLVAIHDGVRPMVSKLLIENSFNSVKKNIGIIPTIPISDSIRYVETNENSKHIDRTKYRAIQTPQTFIVDEIKQAYNKDYDLSFTDDAGVFEANGGKINLIDGNVENIKITTPNDVIYFDLFLKNKKLI